MDAWEAEERSRHTGGDRDLKPTCPLASPPCTKRSRRSIQKRVVSIPIGDAEGVGTRNGGGEAFPPSDSWAWRKYGQKPIKGSPYPRGYYRCSSWKGCPARKQVERSSLEPATLVVSYSFEHNHPWPLPKNGRHHQNRSTPAAQLPVEEPAPSSQPCPPEPEEKCPEVIGEDEPLLLIDDGGFRWFSDVASPCSTSAGSDELLYGSVHFGGADAEVMPMPEEREAAAAAGEEDSLFAGLEELPESSMVLRRGLASASASSMGTNG
ncbi:WRKY transcription factor [Musa troglodytarum]|uniref:WRKY transcription factor n=1 Tax=Musa troglodytarum TaxID=320322 RepID=A0A9E7KQQ7_9LILI|nr:WRKY transcription factor [Musa troglodytarum]URE35504.1 WRKY transcription factor [Musa troglodytarum]